MHTETGAVVPEEIVKTLSRAEQKKYIPVRRDLTVKEHTEGQIHLYSPCGCGSGKKFKFCCKK